MGWNKKKNTNEIRNNEKSSKDICKTFEVFGYVDINILQ